MNNLYVALDFKNGEEANLFLKQHDLEGVPVKIGMELFYREGPDLIKRLKENNHSIFLDLKLYDIPTTVYRAMKNIAKLEVDMVNVHALGGSDMIKQAKEGLIDGANGLHQTKLIAVTILTSLDRSTMNNELLLPGKICDNSVHLASIAKQSHADGVVCSVHEALAVKEYCGSTFLTITPGIRLHGSSQDDQKRVATPHYARNNGADILVMGRNIINALNPKEIYKQAIKEWKYGINQ